MQDEPQPSDAVIKVLGEALVNSELRTQLRDDAVTAGESRGLSESECNELKDTLDRIEAKTSGSLDALAEVCHIYLCLHGFCPK